MNVVLAETAQDVSRGHVMTAVDDVTDSDGGVILDILDRLVDWTAGRRRRSDVSGRDFRRGDDRGRPPSWRR